jgi:hypothetical protein
MQKFGKTIGTECLSTIDPDGREKCTILGSGEAFIGLIAREDASIYERWQNSG